MPHTYSVSGPGIPFDRLLRSWLPSPSCISHPSFAAPETADNFTEPVPSLNSRSVPGAQAPGNTPISGLILLANPRPECWWPALPLFTFHRAVSFLGLPRQSLLPEVIKPEAEPEAPFKCGCHVRRCVAESRSGTLEGTMADWTRGERIRG